MEPEKKGIGLPALVALVVSSSIGAGIFALTSNLSSGAAAGPALIAWVIVGFGILLLALSLSNLGNKRPDLEGIFTYAEDGFGHFAGFVSGWGYWLSAWLGNVAFATVLMSSLGYFFPAFKGGQNVPSIIVASIVSWILTWVVNRGVESAAAINAIVTICKIIPLFAFIVVGIVLFKGHIFTTDFWTNVASHAGRTDSIWTQVKSTILVLMWVFVGVEGATMMSSRARKKSDASKATIIGLISLLIIYVLGSMLPYGYMSQEKLATIQQPAMVYIFKDMLGTWGGAFISVGLIISILGSWLSWTMLPAETMLLMKKSKLLPPIFGRENKHNAPTFSLIMTGVLIQLFLLSLLFAKNAYTFALSLCTAAIVICYIFVGMYQVKYSWQHRSEKGSMGQMWIGVFATAFQVFGILMAGWQYLLLCLIVYVPGIFFYAKANKDNGAGHYLSKMEWVASIVITIAAIVGIVLLSKGLIAV